MPFTIARAMICSMEEHPVLGERRYIRRLAANARHGPELRPDDILYIEEWDGSLWQPVGQTTGRELLDRTDE